MATTPTLKEIQSHLMMIEIRERALIAFFEQALPRVATTFGLVPSSVGARTGAGWAHFQGSLEAKDAIVRWAIDLGLDICQIVAEDPISIRLPSI